MFKGFLCVLLLLPPNLYANNKATPPDMSRRFLVGMIAVQKIPYFGALKNLNSMVFKDQPEIDAKIQKYLSASKLKDSSPLPQLELTAKTIGIPSLGFKISYELQEKGLLLKTSNQDFLFLYKDPTGKNLTDLARFLDSVDSKPTASLSSFFLNFAHADELSEDKDLQDFRDPYQKAKLAKFVVYGSMAAAGGVLAAGPAAINPAGLVAMATAGTGMLGGAGATVYYDKKALGKIEDAMKKGQLKIECKKDGNGAVVPFFTYKNVSVEISDKQIKERLGAIEDKKDTVVDSLFSAADWDVKPLCHSNQKPALQKETLAQFAWLFGIKPKGTSSTSEKSPAEKSVN